MPWAADAPVTAHTDQSALVQWPAEVRATIGDGADRRAFSQYQDADVPELPAHRPAIGQLVERAQVVPAEGGEVCNGLGVIGPRGQVERQMAAQVPAEACDREAGERKRLAAALAAGRPGDQRRAEECGGRRVGGGVRDADTLLFPVQN